MSFVNERSMTNVQYAMSSGRCVLLLPSRIPSASDLGRRTKEQKADDAACGLADQNPRKERIRGVGATYQVDHHIQDTADTRLVALKRHYNIPATSRNHAQ